MGKHATHRAAVAVLGSLGAGALALSAASPAAAAITRESREDRFTFEWDGRDVTCRIFSNFEWDPDTDELGVNAYVIGVEVVDHEVCRDSSPDVTVSYETPDGRVVTQRVTGGGGDLRADFQGVADDVGMTNQVYFRDPDTYSERYVLPK